MFNNHKNNLLWLKILILASIFYLLPSLVEAACGDDIGLSCAAGSSIPTGVPTLEVILGTVIRLILSVVGVLFFMMILYSGYNWLTAAGSEEKIKKAKRTIAHAVIALAIILASYMIVNLILSNLQQAMK